MNSKPIVMDNFHTVHTSFAVNFEFKNNIIILIGNSGTGKTAVFSFFQESSAEDERLVCLNYTNVKSDIMGTIEKADGKLIVIDNADILLNKDIRKHIAFDTKNQYFIIGRNVSDLLATEDNLFELKNIREGERTIFTIKKYFE
jgi:hypothetical protein